MSRYELMYIIDPALEDGLRKELIDRFSGLIAENGGTVEKVDEWGKRRLAYPIDYKNEGYYVLVTFSAGPDLPREMERNLQISESILRYLIVKLEQKQTSVKPRPVPVRPVHMAAPVAAPVAAEAAAQETPVEPEEASAPNDTAVEEPAAEPAQE